MPTESNLHTTGSLETRETASLIGSDKVEGTAVYRSNGDKIGQIQRVMIGKQSGKVGYAVMGFGGLRDFLKQNVGDLEGGVNVWLRNRRNYRNYCTHRLARPQSVIGSVSDTGQADSGETCSAWFSTSPPRIARSLVLLRFPVT